MNESSGYSFKFSIVMALYNVEDYLNEAIDSIINQTIGFEDNVQLILVDDGSFDESFEIAQEYKEKYPDNILVFKKENGGQASARNLGLKYAKGKYLNFLDSDDYISKNALKDAYEFFENHFNEIDVLAIPMMLFERVNGPHRLNGKFDKGNRIIDLVNEPNAPLLSSSSSFIKAESFKDYQFDENLVNLEDALVINKILLEKKRYGVINSCNYYYRQRTVRDSTVDAVSEKKEYFTDRLIKFYKNIIDYSISLYGEVPKFIQCLMAYDLQWLLKAPNLDVFSTKEEIKEFWNVLYFVINHIDNDVVIDNGYIESDSRAFFLFLKNNDYDADEVSGLDKNFNSNFFNKEHMELDGDSVLVKTNDYIIDTLNIHRIWLDIVEIRGNTLNISGMFISNFDDSDYSIKVKKYNSKSSNYHNDSHNAMESTDFEEYACKKIKYNTPERNTRSYLGYNWKYIFNFDVKIPLKNGEKSRFEFIIYYDNGEIRSSFEAFLGLNHNVGLSNYSAYFSKKPYIVLFKDLRLHIIPYSYLSMIRFEYSNIKRTLKDKPDFYSSSLYKKALYYISYPFMINKRIWIFSDRNDFADDNARHLFLYSLSQNDDIKKYFVVNEDSSSFKDMKNITGNGLNEGSVLPFGSLKHKILYLFAEKAISSYTNEEFINPFYEHDNKELFAGLITTERLFLQHGVTKDDISRFVKKYNNNLSLILTVSDLERESFLNEGYNFDESIIPVLGFPRFDNLLNSDNIFNEDEYKKELDIDKKQILFMPTWRKDLENKNQFLASDYFKSLNNILNNEKLFSILNEKGYKLIFKPHAEIIDYLGLFEFNNDLVLSIEDSYKGIINISNCNLSFDDSYQNLFKDSSILITDYSSVFFDFAYIKKPVIYYQENDDYHYDEGYFDYETMGFGELIDNENDLINKIYYYLENDCIMEDNFKNNVDKFFKFIDKKNCERVYNWIIEH